MVGVSTVDVTIGLAFLAGLLSFISPCVLPLVPAYVSYMGARATRQVSTELALSGGSTAGGSAAIGFNSVRFQQVLHGLFFVFGFSAIFVGFGILVNAGINLFHISSYDLQNSIARVGGVLIILLGLQVMGVYGWLLSQIRAHFHSSAGAIDRVTGVLYADTRRQIDPRNPYGYLGSALMGIVFAAGWTPCVGPIYGAIIALAAPGTIGQSVILLAAYSLGLGVPFMLLTLGVTPVQRLLKRLQRYMRAIEIASGLLLILVGYLLFTNQLTLLTARSAGLSDFSYNLEQCGTGLFDNGKVPLKDFNTCMTLGTNYQYQGSNAAPNFFNDTPTPTG